MEIEFIQTPPACSEPGDFSVYHNRAAIPGRTFCRPLLSYHAFLKTLAGIQAKVNASRDAKVDDNDANDCTNFAGNTPVCAKNPADLIRSQPAR
jgi:hypothetical protein